MDIATIGGNQVAYSPTVSIARTSQTEAGTVTATTFGDTVEISDEARALAVAGLEDADAGTSPTEGGTSAAADEDDSADELAEIQAAIAALRADISGLRGRTMTDDSAGAELVQKQAELAALVTELAQAQRAAG